MRYIDDPAAKVYHKTHSSDGYNAAASAVFTVGFHDGEIAISLVMLAHLTFDRDNTAYQKVEALLDEAWDYLNSNNQEKDGNYAYVLRKCAPSFEYFQRPMGSPGPAGRRPGGEDMPRYNDKSSFPRGTDIIEGAASQQPFCCFETTPLTHIRFFLPRFCCRGI